MMSRIASFILRLIGWRTVYVAPPGSKGVITVYPHTSNWDFPLGMLFRFEYKLLIHWAAKDSLFCWPQRKLLLRLGGVPINRRERTGMIAQLAAEFEQNEPFLICITPEGTRAKTDHWKSGFYRLALAAKVPVGLGFIDFRTKRLGVERWVTLSGDEETDLETKKRKKTDKIASKHEKAGHNRLKSA